MDSPQKMDVTDWQDLPHPTVPKVKARRSFLQPTFIGILGTLLLHAAFIQSVSFGSRISKPKQPESQESALAKSATSDESLVLISLTMIANTSQVTSESALPSLPDLSKIKIQPRISTDPPEFLDLETLALSEDQASHAVSGEEDSAEKARLFGIYTGQIQARIDRVWRRPRTSVNEITARQEPVDAGASFQCEAQIIQDLRGNVQEILLPRCNGSTAWQHSLVVAIQQASPLPAPPSIKVFTQSITLRFIGLPYMSGSSNDGYEIEGSTLARDREL